MNLNLKLTDHLQIWTISIDGVSSLDMVRFQLDRKTGNIYLRKGTNKISKIYLDESVQFTETGWTILNSSINDNLEKINFKKLTLSQLFENDGDGLRKILNGTYHFSNQTD